MADENTQNPQNPTDGASAGQSGTSALGAGGQPTGQGETPSTPQGGQPAPGTGVADRTGDDGKGQDDGKPDAPTGEYQFQAPEGMELDTAAVEAFTPVAQELGLNQEQAQKLVDLYATRVQENQTEQSEAWARQLDQWVDDLKNDPEIGGRNFDSSLRDAGRAMDKFATPELRSFLDESGLGNHPELVKLMAKIGKEVGEDNLISPPGSSGTQQPAGDKTYADILYGGGEK